MKTKPFAFFFVIFSTIFTTAGQILWKMGSANLEPDLFILLTNIPLLAGFACYAIGAVILIISLKYGELSVLYPLYATSYIWVVFLAPIFFGDQLSVLKLIGVFVIIAGVTAIGFGSRSEGDPIGL